MSETKTLELPQTYVNDDAGLRRLQYPLAFAVTGMKPTTPNFIGGLTNDQNVPCILFGNRTRQVQIRILHAPSINTIRHVVGTRPV